MRKKKDTQQAGTPCSDFVAAILDENSRRIQANNAKFNPITGEGSTGKRVKVTIKDFPLPVQWLPEDMLDVQLVKKLIKAKTVKKFIEKEFKTVDVLQGSALYETVVNRFLRIRYKYDFPFWADTLVYIKPKGGGDDINFKLSLPQRKLINAFETMRLAGKPIRLVLLKARQWGGSTATQIYMAWLQLMHMRGLNSLIVGHQNASSIEVKDMFNRLIRHYPVEMLHEMGQEYDNNEPKIVGVEGSTNIKRVPQRNFKIKIGSAETPDSARGGDYNLVHLTEVGLFKKTEGKTPEEIVQSACSGVLNKAGTMIVYESTAKGSGNFFHKEWVAARDGTSNFMALFISWYEIPWNSEPLEDPAAFARWLYNNRNRETVENDREEPGTYLWRLWQRGATLEGINWYIIERRKHTSHASMASECPTDDIEAFTFSGRKVFDDEDVERLRPSCKPPKIIGDIYGAWDAGEGCLDNLRIKKQENGLLWVWQDVEPDDEQEKVLDRYLVVVDVCKGMSAKADYAVIAVFDRLYMMDGDNPSIVAQWRGHIEMDRLAWKAAQIAEYYNHALLVIESNTLETNNTRSEAEYILTLVREQYDNLYARKTENSGQDVKEKAPVKYGFHTNVKTKGDVIVNLQTVVREGLYTERDERCLEEYKVYVQNEKGVYEAPAGFHDDMLMTRAIGMWICLFDMERPRIRKLTPVRPPTDKPISAATI